MTLKRKLEDLLSKRKDHYWDGVQDLADSIEMITEFVDNEDFQLNPILTEPERTALAREETKPRNWSVYLRAPLSYFEIFGATQ